MQTNNFNHKIQGTIFHVLLPVRNVAFILDIIISLIVIVLPAHTMQYFM